jgi:hypothetical protein
MPEMLASARSIALGAVLLVSLCGCTASRSPARGSSETHFLQRCTDTCGGDLECVCGACSRRCASDTACAGLAAFATCSQPDAAACGTPAEATAACELTCGRDADCRVLSDDHLCTGGVCRAGVAPPEDAGSSPETSTPSDATVGVSCGAVTCALGERCCNPCQGSCVGETFMIDCPADVGEVTCDGGAIVGACGSQGESCLDTACCNGFLCCSGPPIPMGEAICYGGGTCPMSDRNVKSDIEPVDTDAVLAGVAQLPIARWRYTGDPARAPHIGPMAQDFQAAFAVGEDDRHIFSADGDGVALAAIQALHRRVVELERTQQALHERNAELARELERLRRSAR